MPDTASPLPIATSGGITALVAEMRAVLRSDEEMWMRTAAQRWAHARTLADTLREYGARGDRVAIDLAGAMFEGVVVGVGDDRVDVRTPGAIVTVHTGGADATGAPFLVRRVTAARAGGQRLPASLGRFTARLRELETEATPVRVGTLLGAREVAGVLVVGRDHVLIAGDAEVTVPTRWVAYVVAPVESAA